MTHVGNPSKEEIVGARTWLVNATGIPQDKIVGFRQVREGVCHIVSV